MAKQSLGLMGSGAFGSLAATRLALHFDLLSHDKEKDLVFFAKDVVS